MNLTMCSFCGKNQAEVRKLIAGPGVYICDSCINICKAIITKEDAADSRKKGKTQTECSPLTLSILGKKIGLLNEVRDRLSLVRELRELKAISAEVAEDLVQELCKRIEKGF